MIERGFSLDDVESLHRGIVVPCQRHHESIIEDETSAQIQMLEINK